MDYPQAGVDLVPDVGAMGYNMYMPDSAINAAIRELIDLGGCPACGARLSGPVCGHCRLNLAGPAGSQLARESQAAASALGRRQYLLDRLKADSRAQFVPWVGGAAAGGPGQTTAPPAPTSGAIPQVGLADRAFQAGHIGQTAAPLVPGPGPTQPFGPAATGYLVQAADDAYPRPIPPQAWAQPPAPRPVRQFAPTSVFAIVGAGLIAAAAIVLAFSAIELALWLRQGILGLTTLTAIGAVLALRRRAMAASTQAFGALSGALAVTDMILIAQGFTGDVAWRVAAASCAGLAVGFGLLGFRLRVRAWVTTAVVLAPIWPLLLVGTLGALPGNWPPVGFMGLCLVVTAIAALRLVLARWWTTGRLGFEHGWMTVAAAGGLAGAALSSVVLYLAEAAPGQWTVWLGLLAAAAAGLVHGRLRPGLWTWFGGALLVGTGASVVPAGSFGGHQQGFIVPALAGILAWVIITGTAWIPGRDWARARSVYSGAWVAVIVMVVRSLPTYLDSVIGPLGKIASRGVDAGVDLQPFILRDDWPDPLLWVALPMAFLVVLIGPLALAKRGVRTQAADGPAPDRLAGAFGPGLSDSRLSGQSPVPAPSNGRRPAGLSTMWSIARALVGPMAVIVACCVVTVPGLPAWGSFAGGLVVVAVAWVAAEVLRRRAGAGHEVAVAGAWLRRTLAGSGAVVLVWIVAMSWGSRLAELVVGGVAVALTLGAQVLVKPAVRPVLVAIGYIYSLVLLVAGLIWYPIAGSVPTWAPVVTVPALVACIVSLVLVCLRRIDRRSLGVVLAVSSVPWVAAIASTAVDRTWWAAAAAMALAVVQLLVVGLRDRPIPHGVRLLAAAALVPTGCVVVINAGARLISGSGSPILLPIVTVLAAAGAIGAQPWSRQMVTSGREVAQADQLRRAVELSALATGVVAVALSITRSATGPTTTLIVCAIAAAAASALAWQPGRHKVWWVAGLAYCGVAWSALRLLNVGLVEAYTAPPALAGLIVSLILLRRRSAWRGLTISALGLLIAPSLVLCLTGNDASGRAAVLAGGSVVLLAAGLAAWRRQRWQIVVDGVGWMTGLAGLAPAVAAAHILGRFGSVARPADDWFASAHAAVFGRQNNPWAPSWLVEGMARSATVSFATAVILFGLSAGLVAAGGWLVRLATLGGVQGNLTDRSAGLVRPEPDRHRSGDGLGQLTGWGRLVESSWAFPAIVVAAAGPIMAVRFTWAVEVAMLMATLTVLAAAIRATRQRVVGRVTLPPPILLWLVAVAVGIAGWSMRELRVEAYSLPLGVGLLICGLVALKTETLASRGLGTWPVGFRNPGHVLVPGQLAILGPSTLAIGTDPVTIRAVAVVVMALAFMLVAARKLWTASMAVAVADLALAILIVFTARREAISSVPWLLTLAGAGGVLLTLAMYGERKRRTVPAQADSVKAVE